MTKVSKYGQWQYPGEDTIIPNVNGSITMQGVSYPVLGIDDLGNHQMMYPGQNYKFPGNSVYEIPMMANGGDISVPNLKAVKIKSLPKAQDMGSFTPEQTNAYEKAYSEYRTQGDDPNYAHKQALRDVYYSNTGNIINIQPFLPNEDSGVRVASGKKYPLEYIDFSTYDPWQQNTSDADFLHRYNKQSPEIQELMKSQIINNESADLYFNNLNDVKHWEKDWYTKRAKLPQFKDVAEKRLGLVENINMQPWGNGAEYISEYPGSSGVYSSTKNSVNIPATSFNNASTIAHERSHWYDFNAPQNNDKYLFGTTAGLPKYNNEDPILNNIIPSNYKLPYGLPIVKRVTSIPNLPTASDDITKESVTLPFKNSKKTQSGDDPLDYYYNPTEVRARTNEWRMDQGIDPTKNYSNEEIQQIIDKDIESGNTKNLDLYKIVRGKGDLLKQIHDAYVSNDKSAKDEFPKAQIGGSTEEEILANRNRAFQDIIVDDTDYDLPQAVHGIMKQDGGDMPFGLPLKEQNIYTLPEYNQPKNPKTGEILPDPQRPGLGMNTGATEYKYTYGFDDGDVDVPSIVAGQYIGNQAIDRYMLSGERFKTMNDPSAYSKFYDVTKQLGIMQEQKQTGGEKKNKGFQILTDTNGKYVFVKT